MGEEVAAIYCETINARESTQSRNEPPFYKRIEEVLTVGLNQSDLFLIRDLSIAFPTY